MPRVDEGVQADLGERAGLAACEIAEQLGDDALRQIIGVDFFIEGQLAHRRHASPIAATTLRSSPSWPRRLKPLVLLSPWPAVANRLRLRGVPVLEIAALERLEQRFGHAGLHEAKLNSVSRSRTRLIA